MLQKNLKMITRYFKNLNEIMLPRKVLIIYGARRVGKTTLLNELLKKCNLKYKIDSGDNIRIQQILGSRDFNQILEYASGYDLIAIDEAQQIHGIGMGLKILVDNLPDLKIIATGSSSFDLSQNIGEPLTGRKKVITLLPISQNELLSIYNKFELREKLNEYLVFGSYPEILTTKNKKDKIEILDELVNSYLLKDILILEKVKSPKLLMDLLKLLAFQVGNIVSINELACQLSVNVRTIARYLDLLEKTFVIFNIRSYSQNLRKEIAKKSKYYFWDNGVRNAIIMQFNDIDNRNDIGALWENFIIYERIKKTSYQRIFCNRYFWRNYNQQEIDMIEVHDSIMYAYEIKWQKGKASLPSDFIKHYSKIDYSIINKKNYMDFII